ncbi:MAG: glucose PTS transporter subunit IIA [Clostridiales bacterium]|jgi:PTS system beta-glucosides-specific IIC component|nr:glucose PTS transporter subunit IIA [Clostridiales bacterium]
MAVDKDRIAKEIIPLVGGVDNVDKVVHCATRLRFTLKDYDVVDIDKLKSTYGVISAFYKAGVIQVVIGNKVSDVYKSVNAELRRLGKIIDTDTIATNATNNKQPLSWSSVLKVIRSLPSRFIDTCSAVFTPIMLVIASSGILWGLYNIFTVLDWLDESSDLAKLWGAIADVPLYYLPILLGHSAGKKFGCNIYITMCIGAVLVYPDIIAQAGSSLNIGFVNIKIISYAKSVLPILFACYLDMWVERLLNKIIPLVVRSFLVPIIALIVVVPLTLGIIGPIFMAVSDGLAQGYEYIPGWLAGMIVGAIWQLVVMFGFHHAFNAVDQININARGFSSLWTYREMSVMSQTGAATGVYLKCKDKRTRGMTLANVVTGVFGVTEPLLYGVTLPRKKVFVMGLVGGLLGGLFVGIIGGGIFVQGGWGILSLLSGIDKDGLQGPAFGRAFFGALIGMAVAFGVSLVLVLMFCKIESSKTRVATYDTVDNTPQLQSNSTQSQDNVLVLKSPLVGRVLPLSCSSDPVFATQTMGKGVLIVPEQGKLYSPCDATITVVFDTKHMIGLKAVNGAEIIIHVGIDTVELNGQYFETHVLVGDRVDAGQLLMEFDVSKIVEAGYNVETPVIVTNTDDFVVDISQPQVNIDDDIIKIQ